MGDDIINALCSLWDTVKIVVIYYLKFYNLLIFINYEKILGLERLYDN